MFELDVSFYFSIYFVKLISAEALCNFYVQYGGRGVSDMRQGISSKISENHIYFGLGLYRLSENKCGRLLKFCVEIGSQRPVLAGNGPAYLCKGKINERTLALA